MRCYACCQENCGYRDCDCHCHGGTSAALASLTLRARVLTFVRSTPGRTATDISRHLHESPASVSSLLKRMCDAGQLTRMPGVGPRGGCGYFDA